MNYAPDSAMLPRRFYVPRCVGLALGCLAVYPSLPIASVWYEITVILLGGYCFLWPHAAYLFARSSARPIWVERRSMLVDASMAGIFSGVIGLDPIPSVAIVSMVTMNNMAMGGPRFMLTGVLFTVFGVNLGYLMIEQSNEIIEYRHVLTCIPLLILYPLSLGYVCYRTARSLRYQKKQLRIISQTDYLTGLFNRSALNKILEDCITSKARDLQRDVVALIDIDGFKQINDQQGHSGGDNILKEISRIMCLCIRTGDTIGRYGGDEFCVILRDVSRVEAEQILERMRAYAYKASFMRKDAPSAIGTLSIGAAFYNPLADTVAKWIELADHAMYQAKRNGRNQVVFTF